MLAQTCWLQSVVDGHCEASLSHSAPANKKKNTTTPTVAISDGYYYFFLLTQFGGFL